MTSTGTTFSASHPSISRGFYSQNAILNDKILFNQKIFHATAKILAGDALEVKQESIANRRRRTTLAMRTRVNVENRDTSGTPKKD